MTGVTNRIPLQHGSVVRLGAVSILLAVVILSGCGDATGPDTTTVAVEILSVSGPDISQSGPSETNISCGVAFSAHATGAGSATWVDALVLVFAGPDRSTAVDTIQIAAPDLQAAWGAADIEAGQDQTSAWTLTANVPFGLKFIFRYRNQVRAVRTTSASFTCGPDIPPGSAPPTLKNVSVQPGSGEVESGDTLLVSYTAESAVGLWETQVVVSGACDAQFSFPERFATSATRTVPIYVPAGCQLGSLIAVKVRAMDIGLRSVEAALNPGLTFVDRTPPEVGVWFGNGGSPELDNFYFAGDTILASIGAGDNNAMSAAFWQASPAGWRDSIRSSEQSLAYQTIIPIRDDWVGPFQLKVYARDAAGLFSDTLVKSPKGGRIYPTVLRPTRFTPPIIYIHAMALDARRNKAWVLVQDPNPSVPRVYGVDLRTMAMTDTIRLTSGGWDLDMTAGGDSLIVLESYGFAVIDLGTRTETRFPIRSVDSTIGQYPQAVRVAGNGKIFVVAAGQTAQANTLIEIDLPAGTDHVRTEAGANGVVDGVWIEPSLDRSVLFVKGYQRIQQYVSATDAFRHRKRTTRAAAV